MTTIRMKYQVVIPRPTTYWKTKNMLIAMTSREKINENTLDAFPLVNECIIFGFDEKAMVGIKANGSWRDIRQLSKSFIPDKFWMS